MAHPVLLNHVIPCNGLQLAGENGITGTGAKDWYVIMNAKVFTFQNLLNGTLAAHCTVEIQACLAGGEASPAVLATWDSSTATILWTASNVAYDKIRLNVTAYTSSGLGSQVLMSCR